MKRIIVVDDDPSILDAIRYVFDNKEYNITVYNNGDAILDMTFDIPDLFILDKQLSGVDGLDVCIFLKKQQQTKDIPVIMLSASPSIIKTAPQAGAEGALEKPFKIDALQKLASQLINRKND